MEPNQLRTRYAIYFMPSLGSNYTQRGASWLGYDAWQGLEVRRLGNINLSMDVLQENTAKRLCFTNGV